MAGSLLATLCAAVALSSTGCLTVTTGQMAGTLGPGHLQVGFEPGTWSGTEDGFITTEQFNVAVRYGVSRRVDVGARFGSAPLELSGKVLLTDPASPGPVVSVAPQIGLASGGPVYLVCVQVPVLLGLRLGGGNEIVAAPKLLAWHFITGGPLSTATGDTLAVGGSLGVALALSPSVHVLPELAVAVPLVTGRPPSIGSTGGFIGDEPNVGTLVQFQIGILIGGGT